MTVSIADYSEAIRLDPNAGRLVDRGNAYGKKNDPDRAIADFSEAIRLDPKSALAYNNRGYEYYGKKDYDRAIADYDEAIQLEPKRPPLSHQPRQRSTAPRARSDTPLTDYSELIALDPKNAYRLPQRAGMA